MRPQIGLRPRMINEEWNWMPQSQACSESGKKHDDAQPDRNIGSVE
jgi:hypothetical protein